MRLSYNVRRWACTDRLQPSLENGSVYHVLGLAQVSIKPPLEMNDLHSLHRPPITLNDLEERLPLSFTEVEIQMIRTAYDLTVAAHADVLRSSGEPFIVHPLAVAGILADLRVDANAIAAGLLHDVAEDGPVSIDEIGKRFGAEVAGLVDGVTKLEMIYRMGRDIGDPDFTNNERASLTPISPRLRSQRIDERASLTPISPRLRSQRDEMLRRMFLTMSKDIRVVLIKLVDRLHNVLTLGNLKDYKRRRIARETLEIYAPLANRLGIWEIEWALEDGAFRWLEPAFYKRIASDLRQDRTERESSIHTEVNLIQMELEMLGITALVEGRPKNIYSIFRDASFRLEQAYYTETVRIVVDDLDDCYVALAVINRLGRPIPGEFDDYIANPKDNMNHLLRAGVAGSDGRRLEVQICTFAEHRRSPFFRSAGTFHGFETQREREYAKKLAWLQRAVTVARDYERLDGSEDFDFDLEKVFGDRVYIFTPQGDIIDLPTEATPIDFAYSVDTDLGHRCRGARVNGKQVALDYKLRTGQMVEIVAATRGGPSRDWLNPEMGYIASGHARTSIRKWLRMEAREIDMRRSQRILVDELRRLKVGQSHESIACLLDYDSVDDFYAAIGFGDIDIQAIARRINQARLWEL